MPTANPYRSNAVDPNKTLEGLRRFVADINARAAAGEEPSAWDAARLAELADDLDTWLSAGGALPAAWRAAGARR